MIACVPFPPKKRGSDDWPIPWTSAENFEPPITIAENAICGCNINYFKRVTFVGLMRKWEVRANTSIITLKMT